MTIRVGIIGAGQAGERHAIGFSTVEAASVVGIADIAEARAQALAQRFDAQAFTDWRAMLDADLDILVVALPHSMHVAPTAAAAERGVHVLMEKPIATTLDDAHRILEMCERGGVKLTISFVHRFREEVQTVQRWLRSGQLGAPQLARETMNGQRGEHLPRWVEQSEIAGGGSLMYSAIHGVDRLRWLLDSDVVAVSAKTRRYHPESEVENGAVALLEFANGAIASLISSAPRYRAQPAHWETEIYGTHGMARLRTRNWAELSNDDAQEHIETASLAEELGPYYNFARQAQAFTDAILHDQEPVITGLDGLRALEICLAIYQSSGSGKAVSL